ncbi:hypothetical protein N0V90_010712 [Kalmusia sp. IMI 367209]|nr:hypothetical protein N0V90_010712 [Kalmusia sp. IMI 367209]
MAQNTNTKTPNPNNLSSLKPRYEIRQLEPKHAQWASSIVIHSNCFHSPVWPVLYPENMNARAFEGLDRIEYLAMHQINSGHSFGVFDTAYKFKREESKATGGKLYWDRNEKNVQEEKGLAAEGQRLLEQMDFPLVSVALSYDGADPLDMEKMGPLMAALPHFGPIYHILDVLDPRDKESWGPKAHREVLMRNATSTRHDYEGENIMAGLARWLMREADVRGFRGIQIECVHDAVTHVWSKPPAPYKGGIVSEFHTGTYKDEEGNLLFAPAQQKITKCYVELKQKA